MRLLKSSPVRGQLDPPDERERTGWRFLQCTETPDEYKVLLPPRTALFYQQLLKAETRELAQEDHISWQRVIYIRYLKDRMIKKCQRLCGWKPPSKPAVAAFLSVHAPPDFRLHEMEQWCKDQRLPPREQHRSPVNPEDVELPRNDNREVLSNITYRTNSSDKQHGPSAPAPSTGQSNRTSSDSWSNSTSLDSPKPGCSPNQGKHMQLASYDREGVDSRDTFPKERSLFTAQTQYCLPPPDVPRRPASPPPLPVCEPGSQQGSAQAYRLVSAPVDPSRVQSPDQVFRLASPPPRPVREPGSLKVSNKEYRAATRLDVQARDLSSRQASPPPLPVRVSGFAEVPNSLQAGTHSGNFITSSPASEEQMPLHSSPLSRGSSISDPVIPDPALLVDAALRHKSRNIPRRRRSSNPSESSSSSGQGSETSSSRRASRRPSTPLRPGILKRSDSQSSHRKSVSFAQPDVQDLLVRLNYAEAEVTQARCELDSARKAINEQSDAPLETFAPATERLKVAEANLIEKGDRYNEAVTAYSEVFKT